MYGSRLFFAHRRLPPRVFYGVEYFIWKDNKICFACKWMNKEERAESDTIDV